MTRAIISVIVTDEQITCQIALQIIQARIQPRMTLSTRTHKINNPLIRKHRLRLDSLKLFVESIEHTIKLLIN